MHRLVAECFLNGGEPIDPRVYAVHHISGDPEDNRVENLIILTHEEHTSLHMKGKSKSEEHKQKMRKPIIGVHKETGCTVEFDSAKDAAIALNIYATSITACCNGRYKSTGGWRFEYKPQNLQESNASA